MYHPPTLRAAPRLGTDRAQASIHPLLEQYFAMSHGIVIILLGVLFRQELPLFVSLVNYELSQPSSAPTGLCGKAAIST